MANTEIERKFLVKVTRELESLLTESKQFEQGYFLSPHCIRVRISDSTSENAKAWLTIKGQGLRTRAEFEYEIPAADAKELMKMCAYTLTKIRHLVTVGKHTWEVDEFIGNHHGLWMAEIELDSEDETFEIPSWAVVEVTEDPRYTNVSLAKTGMVP